MSSSSSCTRVADVHRIGKRAVVHAGAGDDAAIDSVNELGVCRLEQLSQLLQLRLRERHRSFESAPCVPSAAGRNLAFGRGAGVSRRTPCRTIDPRDQPRFPARVLHASFRSMGQAVLEPLTAFMRLDESSTLRKYRELDRFSILGVETTGRLAEAVQKTSTVQALLVSISLRSVPAREYRLRVDGKVVSTGNIPAFRANVIDLAAEPTIWGERGIHYTHFHLRRAVIDELAADLGYARIGDFRGAVAEDDAVLAQMARGVAPFLGRDVRPPPLALDQLELILAAHVMKQYADSRKKSSPTAGGLAAWQRGRVTELLRENLDGAVRLADLARECELSVSHFARSFKASFGVTSHQWLTARRIERAKELLALTKMPLADVGSHSGFGDQAAFTHTFHRVVGATPGQWRREHGGRPER